MKECDGQRTIAEVGQLLFLPKQTLVKVVNRCIVNSWAESGPTDYFQPFWQALVRQLGEGRAEEVAHHALNTAQRKATDTPQRLIEEAFFAFGLALTPEEAEKMGPIFDQLREQYR